MKKRAVLIGAGKIGRGFLGDILYHAGYELTFLVHSPEQTQKMREQGYYHPDSPRPAPRGCASWCRSCSPPSGTPQMPRPHV